MLEYFQSGQRGKQGPTVYQGAMGLDRVVVMVVVVVVGAIVVTSVRNTMTSALCNGDAQGMLVSLYCGKNDCR